MADDAARNEDLRATKAKNLLSSITALSFADADDSARSDEVYRAEMTLIQSVLKEHEVFRLVLNGNALNKFYGAMIQQTKDSNVLRQEMAMQFLQVAVEGSSMEHLETRISKILDVVHHALKHQHASVCIPALHILTHFMFSIDNVPVDSRRAIVDQLGRLVPTILQHIGSVQLSSTTAPFFVASFEALFVGCKFLSTTFRPFASKIEQACIVLLSPPENEIDSALKVLPAMANCLGAVPHAIAADASSSSWQQMIERVILTLQYQLDILDGKEKNSDSRNRPASLKPWLKDNVMPTLPIFLQAQRLAYKTGVLTRMLSSLLKSTAIAEKDVVLVANDVLAVLRRAFSIRADSVGKQSAISEDGRQLPSSVLYGILPIVQPHFFELLVALVIAGHVTIFRFASSIAKLVQLSCHTTLPPAVPSLHTALQQIMTTFGAGAYSSVGVPVLTLTLSQLNSLVVTARPQIQTSSAQSIINTGNKKKRQRQDEVKIPSASTPTVHQIHHTLLVKTSALETLSRALAIYGAYIPVSDRHKITSIIFACQQEGSVDANTLTKVSLANSFAPDIQGGRGLALAQNMQFWSRRTSGSWRELAQVLGESMLHPRAPPMTLTMANVDEKPSLLYSQSNASARSKRLQADMDWDDDDQEEGDDNVKSTKKQKSIDDEKDGVEEKEDEDEDMEDEKAVVETNDDPEQEAEQDADEDQEVAKSENEDDANDEDNEEVEEDGEEIAEETQEPQNEVKEESGDEFEFPDIVVDEDEE